jgi:ketosteroid isomerase-like protein
MGMSVQSDLDPQSEALAADFIAAIEQGNISRLYELCSNDVVIWHNDDNREVDLDRVARILSWLSTNVRGLRYAEIRRRAFAGGYLQQHVLTGVAPNGAELHLPACLIMHVSDGAITRIEEYLDSAGVAVLRADPVQR